MFTLAAAAAGGVDTGWTFYTPYSSIYSNTHVALTVVRYFHHRFFVDSHRAQFHRHDPQDARAGHDLVSPAAVCLGALRDQHHFDSRHSGDRDHPGPGRRWSGLFGLGIFDPALGGDPLLFQHLFWFYSHPAVYIMILPAMGVVSELIACFSRKRIFGYDFVAFASLAIAVLGFLVWGHHMFVSGQSVYASMVFSLLSMLVAIPSAIKVFNWTATLYKGSISFDAPMLYALGFIGLFTIGGLTGLFLATLGCRRPRSRHLFRHRPFSLHHGRRRGDGLSRRHSFLVAEDDRHELIRKVGAGSPR